MTHPVTINAFLSLAIAVFIFFFVIQVNYYEVYTLLQMKGSSNIEIDFIEIMEILAAIGGSIITIQVINNFSNKKIIILCLLTYLVCATNLILFNDYIFTIINLMLMALSRFIFCAVTLVKFVNYYKNRVSASLSLYFFLWAAAYIAGEYFAKLLNSMKISNIILSLAFLQILVIFNFYFSYKNLKAQVNYKKPNFTLTLASIELEALIGFTISYIIFAIYWDQEVFAVNSGYSISKIDHVRLYMIFGILLSLYPIRILVNNYNRFKLNIYFLSTLIISLIFFQVIGNSELHNKLAHCLFGANIYALFINNLQILNDKFIDDEFNYAVSLYLCIGMIGGYIGVIATDNMIETFGALGFLISLYSITVILSVYYLLQFFTRRLYIT